MTTAGAARARGRGALLAALVVAGALGAQPASATEVNLRFVEPVEGQPLLGPVDIRLEVTGSGASSIDRVEVFFDGRLAGTLTRPPYLLRVDAGSSGVEHRLEAAAYAGATAVAHASVQASAIRIDEEIDVRLRQILVTVTRDGAPVRDLAASDFTISEGRREFEIETFAAGELPFTLALLVDASSSMQGKQLEGALGAARALVAALGALDEAKLLLFDDLLRGETPFTNVPTVLSMGLTEIESGGGTAIHDTLWIATHRLSERSGRRIAILLSDGIDVESVLPLDAVRRAMLDHRVQLHWLRLQGAANRQPDQGAKLYTIWHGPDEHRRQIEDLTALTEVSGGSVRTVSGVGDAEAALGQLVAELRGQYALGYAAPADASPKAPRVRVRGGGEVRVRVLEGFAAPR